MNILVVDNEERILQSICRMLRNSGHRIIATTDARHAVETIEHDDIDLLISDVSMPAITGPELVATARRLRPGIPVLYMSASDRPDGCPLLVKPFQTQDLMNAMHQALACASSLAPVRKTLTSETAARFADAAGLNRYHEPFNEDSILLATHWESAPGRDQTQSDRCARAPLRYP